jgi:long-chain acyl-CoA synthetase
MGDADYLQAFEDEVKKWRPIWESHFDEGVPTTYDYSKQPLKWWYNKWAEKYPGKTYMVIGDIELPYQYCNDVSRRFANALLGLGIQKGDRIGTMCPNVPQYVLSINAFLKIGVVESPISPLYTVPEIKMQFNDSGAETVVVMAAFAEKAIALLRDPDSCVKRVIAFQIAGKPVELEKGENIYDFDELCNAASSEEPDIEVTGDDPVRLQYTGGTTGVPKGCVITNYMAHTMGWRGAVWVTQNGLHIPFEELRVLAAVPLNHVYGWNFSININYYSGGSLVLVPQPTPDALLEAITKHKPNMTGIVPAMLIGMINHPDTKSGKADMSSFKTLFSGSAPCPNGVKVEFQNLTGAFVIEGYGMSESTNCLSANTINFSKENSVGVPLQEIDIIMVDIETGTKVVPVGEPGELICRGPQNITEYWNKPEETAIAIRDGWLYTGDIAKIDEDGVIYILDRKKDTIIVSGFNVYPREIDELMYSHPKVKEACAVGLPDPKKGERIKLFVALKDGEAFTAEEVEAYLRQSLAPYKIPSEIEFVDELLRTQMGKADRKAIKEAELKKISAN